jgi:glycosyltransferase A (GT-A) superfamily protein (DUF2064 family)
MSGRLGVEQVTLLVIAKEPLAGRAKTRLIPVLGEHGSAAVAEAALADTLAAVAAVPVDRRILVLEGELGPWLPEGFTVVPQVGGGLGARLAAAFAAACGPALLVGMDTPQITPTTLAALVAGTELGTAQIGLACDGGWWGIGLPTPSAEVFSGVPMSRPDTGHRQLRRLRERYGEVAIGPTLRDVDHWTDALEVADLVPTGSRFAREVRRVAAATAKRRTVGVS